MRNFKLRELDAQSKYFDREFRPQGAIADRPFLLLDEHLHLNLAPSIREAATKYFAEHAISWHRYANHGLSSQVCCLNFLMPLVERPEILAHLVGTLFRANSPVMIPIEQGPDGRPWYLGFEWIGGDYLNEGQSGRRTRGANTTSADAVLRYKTGHRIETLLIEWKYTESYGAPISEKGNQTRIKRYQKLAFHPDGPVRNDLGLQLEDFFYEPYYQLLRQQMLAFQMQKAGEDGCHKVRVLHISPDANVALKRVTAPKLRALGSNAFDVWKKVLVCPTAFIALNSEYLVEALSGADSAWAAYITDRYGFVSLRVKLQ